MSTRTIGSDVPLDVNATFQRQGEEPHRLFRDKSNAAPPQFELDGVILECHVMPDGTRVIDRFECHAVSLVGSIRLPIVVNPPRIFDGAPQLRNYGDDPTIDATPQHA